MSNLVKSQPITAHELALINNDLRNLQPEERLALYNKTCESLGLNPFTQPFGYIDFRGGKLSLYAKKDATDQLRKIHGVSVEIVSKEMIGDNYVVIARAKDASGRCDEDMGSVSIKGLSGDNLGNAMMKAITKAKRRVTLSICGLGLLDETEVDTIPGAKDVTPQPQAAEFSDNKEKPEQVQGKPERQSTPAPAPNVAPQTRIESYKIPFDFGTVKLGTTLPQLGREGVEKLRAAIIRYQNTCEKEGKLVSPKVIEFIEIANEYLKGEK